MILEIRNHLLKRRQIFFAGLQHRLIAKEISRLADGDAKIGIQQRAGA